MPPTAAGLADHLSDAKAIDNLLIENKALIFRGFGVTDSDLEQVMKLLLPNRLAYVHGNSPRTKVGDNVYTSTEYPADFTISMHNELSYARSWPSRLMFFAAQPAAAGGATPLVDAALWLEKLDRELVDAFAGGVRYTQNLHGGAGLGKSWQETFETTSRTDVESFLTASEAAWEWKKDGGLRVRHSRPATTVHPVTGHHVWFNQSDQWHIAALGDETARTMAEILGEDEMPQSVSFANGDPIPDEYVLQIRDRGLEYAVDVEWEQGDVLLFDNVLVAHGRRSFQGARRILVGMSD
ncbi:TauD/TfdA family dioxygenase [Actinoplanes sp. HUAS TT8]|uniref:TauD/TfdA family dioxygenase n=1 Tax=Actinoplanes sp. HUAS TT8 TaxID=3447453 RepID=UPI003F5200D7